MIKQKGNNKKVLIMVPAQAVFKKERTGVEEYLFKLLDAWSVLELKDIQFRIYLKYEVKNLPLFLKKDFFEIKVIRLPWLWTVGRLSLEMIKIIFQRKFSASFRRNFSEAVLFAPTNVMPLIHPKHTIVTIHGLEYEYFPKYYSWFSRKYLRWSTRYATKHASRIIAVSENTKQDLVKLYGCPSEKIEVIWHGIEKKISNSQFLISNQFPISNFQFLNSKYFLYLGRIELKKNVVGIIKAFEEFKIKNSPPAPRLRRARKFQIPNSKFKIQEYKLVLAGGRGYGYESIKLKVQSSKFKEDIIFTGHIGGQNKWKLLKNAEALVFPSFYEGFGLPILEAQSVGVPVITSKGSSMEEITTLNRESLIVNRESQKMRSALLVDPNKPEEIADAMSNIINNQQLRKELIRLGYENVKRFSWEKTARKTLQIFTDYHR